MRKNSKKTKAEPKPGYFTILEGYLHGWAPAQKFTQGGGSVILKTSQEIAADLEDMMEIDSSTIASIMSQLGFKTHFDPDGGPHGWIMLKAPGTSYSLSAALPEEDPEDD